MSDSASAPAAFMHEAIRLAADTMHAGRGGPFGAVIVQGGRILARGANEVIATSDPTAHAEIVAIRAACKLLGSFHLTGCELYTSCEPCPMCLAAIYWARMDCFYFGCTASDAAAIGFSDDAIRRQFALPPEGRDVLALPLMRTEALVPFQVWARKADRVPY